MKIMLTIFLGAAALLALPAQAATICVNKKAPTPPCVATIQEGVDLATAAGDIVAIKAATYFENVTVPLGKDGIIIKGSGKTIIDPGGLPAAPALTILSANVTVTGLSINNVDDNGIDTDVTAAGLIVTKVSFNRIVGTCIRIEGNGARITGNKFFSCDGDGVRVITGNTGTFSKNKFTHIGSNAIRLNGDTHIVDGNLCARVDTCVRADAGSDGVMILRNKTIEHSGISYRVEGANALFERNSSVSGGGSLIFVDGASPRLLGNKGKNDGGGISVTCDPGPCVDSLLERNSVSNTAGTDCFFLDYAVSGAVVLGNSGKECGGNGMQLRGAGEMSVQSNKVIATGYAQDHGFHVRDAGLKTLFKNSATFAGGNGFDVDGVLATPIAHVLELNKATKNAGDGFNLNQNTSGVLLTGNSATANIQEGFDDRGMSNVYTANKASGNREGSDFCSTQGTIPDATNKFKTTSSPNCVFP